MGLCQLRPPEISPHVVGAPHHPDNWSQPSVYDDLWCSQHQPIGESNEGDAELALEKVLGNKPKAKAKTKTTGK